jgi:DUF1365 family protein
MTSIVLPPTASLGTPVTSAPPTVWGGLHSAIYEGAVRHRRFRPKAHSFRTRLFMLYLDLAELDEVFAEHRFWSVERRNVASFQRRDYLGDAHVPLDQAVRDRVEAAGGARPRGPIRMLTNLRYFGYSFNPVTFYYCFPDGGDAPEAIVAEITNTPWRERHQYVLLQSDAEWVEDRQRFRFAKAFHVSPFMPMDLTYEWQFATPGERLFVHMENEDDAGTCFDATLGMRRRDLDGPGLSRMLRRYPAMTAKVSAVIHLQALKLWRKGNPVHRHPNRRTRGGQARKGS